MIWACLCGFVICPGGVLEKRLPGSGLPKHLQQQTVGDIWPLAALQRQHVLLPRGGRYLCTQAHELPRALVKTHSAHLSHLSAFLLHRKCDSRHVTVVPCLRPLLLLQPDVQPQASLVEGAPAEAGRFRRAAQERAVGDAERSDQSAALPAGRRSHLLPHGSGEGTTSFQKWRCWRSLNLWMKHATAYYESPPEFWFIWDFFFLLDYRLSLRWKAASTSCGVFMTFLDSPSSFTSPHAQRSIWGTSPCGTRPRRWRMSCIVDKNFRTIEVDFKLKIRHKVWNEELDNQN